MNSPVPTTTKTADIVGETIFRSQMKAYIADATEPLVFERCDFEGADLSRLDVSGFEFSGCSFIETSLYAATMPRTVWLKSRGRQADFESADLREADIGGVALLDARLFQGATISHQQASELLAELGLIVA